MTTQLTDTIALLERGRDRIEAGWIQGGYEDKSGAVCALGAIQEENQALDGRVVQNALIFLDDALSPQEVERQTSYPYEVDNTPSIVDFNDASGRRKRDVLRLYKRAIDKAININDLGLL